MLNTGATAWMLTSASLVLLMTPALAMFYGGMSRQKSVLNMMMMVFGALGLIAIIYPLWGWSMTYGGQSIGGIFANPFEQFGLLGSFDGEEVDDYGVPIWVSVAFQSTFAIITVALIAGSLAERVKFGAWMVFAALWATLAYFPMAHMVWGGGLLSPDGPIAAMTGTAPIDFAGGTVVHINAGMAALVLALVIGARRKFGEEQMRPHSLPLIMLGSGLLFFGWFGFNGGSAFTADGLAGMAWVNTTTAAGAAMLGWMGYEWARGRHATSLGAASGVVAGLVAITPAAGALTPLTSVVLGLLAGVVCAAAVGLKYRWKMDDSLDVVGVHLVGGLVGTVMIGFLAAEGGLFFGGGFSLLVTQVLIAVVALVISGIVTFILAKIVGALIGWRLTDADELLGIDLTQHAETAYETPTLAGRL